MNKQMPSPDERAKQVTDKLKEAMLEHTLYHEGRWIRLSWEGERFSSVRYVTLGNRMQQDLFNLEHGRMPEGMWAGEKDVEYAQVIKQHYRNLQDLATRPERRREYVNELKQQLETGVIMEPPLLPANITEGRDKLEAVPLKKKWEGLRGMHPPDGKIIEIIDGFFAGNLEKLRDPEPLLRRMQKELAKEKKPLSKAEIARQSKGLEKGFVEMMELMGEGDDPHVQAIRKKIQPSKRQLRREKIDEVAGIIKDNLSPLPEDVRNLGAITLLKYLTQDKSNTYKYILDRVARDVRKDDPTFANVNDRDFKKLQKALEVLDREFSKREWSVDAWERKRNKNLLLNAVIDSKVTSNSQLNAQLDKIRAQLLAGYEEPKSRGR